MAVLAAVLAADFDESGANIDQIDGLRAIAGVQFSGDFINLFF